MKNKINQIGIIFLLTLTLSCSKSNENTNIQAPCLSTTLQNGVIAFYPFSNGSINDYSGNNYNLTNSTSAASGADRNGNPNCAFRFIAANGEYLKYINPTFIDNFQTLPFSISLWYKNETSTSSNYELLIGRDTNLHCPDTYGQWSVGLYDNRRPVFGINSYELWWNIIGTNVSSQEWRHLVITCMGTDLKIYLNGVLTSGMPVTGCSTIIPTINAGDLFLGKDYTGLLDDVIIYNRVLSQTEVNELYALTTCCQ